MYTYFIIYNNYEEVGFSLWEFLCVCVCELYKECKRCVQWVVLLLDSDDLMLCKVYIDFLEAIFMYLFVSVGSCDAHWQECVCFKSCVGYRNVSSMGLCFFLSSIKSIVFFFADYQYASIKIIKKTIDINIDTRVCCMCVILH